MDTASRGNYMTSNYELQNWGEGKKVFRISVSSFITGPDFYIGTFLSIKEPLLCPYEQLVQVELVKGYHNRTVLT